MIISVARPFGDDAQQAEHRREGQHPARDLASELIDPSFERRLCGLDVAEHRGQPAHGAGRASARGFQIRLAADDHGAAERLVTVSLVEGHGFASEDGFIQQDAVSVYQRSVGWDPVTGLKAHPVPRNQGLYGEADEVAVAKHPRPGSSQRLQPSERGFGPLFLIEAERRIEQENESDGARFNRPGVRAFIEPEAEIKDEGEQQDVDQWALELTQEAAPEWIRRPLGQRVRPDMGEPSGGFGGGESVHRDAMGLSKGRASRRGRSTAEATSAHRHQVRSRGGS